MSNDQEFNHEAFWREVAERRQEDAILHIRAQRRWHDDAGLMGSRQGLLRLRAAIDDALASGLGFALVTTFDDEGYVVAVFRNDAAPINDVSAIMSDAGQFHPAWQQLFPTYTELIAAGQRITISDLGEPPWGILSTDEYVARREAAVQQQVEQDRRDARRRRREGGAS